MGSKRDEVTGEWRKLRNEELNDLYWSLNIVQVIKLRRMRWVGHMGEWGGIYWLLVGEPDGKGSLVILRCRWEEILGWMFWKWGGEAYTGLIWLVIGTGGRHV